MFTTILHQYFACFKKYLKQKEADCCAFFKQKYFCVCFSSCFQRVTDQDYRQVTLVPRSFNSRIWFGIVLLKRPHTVHSDLTRANSLFRVH